MTTDQTLQDAAERWKRATSEKEPLESIYGHLADTQDGQIFYADCDQHLLATHAANLITSPPPATDERARHAEAVEAEARIALIDGFFEQHQNLTAAAKFLRGLVG